MAMLTSAIGFAPGNPKFHKMTPISQKNKFL